MVGNFVGYNEDVEVKEDFASNVARSFRDVKKNNLEGKFYIPKFLEIMDMADLEKELGIIDESIRVYESDIGRDRDSQRLDSDVLAILHDCRDYVLWRIKNYDLHVDFDLDPYSQFVLIKDYF